MAGVLTLSLATDVMRPTFYVAVAPIVRRNNKVNITEQTTYSVQLDGTWLCSNTRLHRSRQMNKGGDHGLQSKLENKTTGKD